MTTASPLDPPESVVMAEPRAVAAPGGGPVERSLALAPLVDKNPIVIGQNLSLAYMATAYRAALGGYRQAYCDLLSELLEHDPQSVATFGQRVLNVACARFEIIPADLPDGDERIPIAEAIAGDCRQQWERLPMRSQTISQLMWAVVSGLTGGENYWEPRRDGMGRWRLAKIGFIHTRRLSMPDQGSWDVHVYDGGGMGASAFEGLFQGGRRAPQAVSIRCADYPGKFVLHAPQLRAEYPTRDGLGRVVGTYMLLKRMVLRNSAQDSERFTKPWAIAYSRALDGQGRPRAANEKDIAAGDLAIKALGVGALSGASLPDSIKIELLKASTELSVKEFTEYLDGAIAKVALGQTFTVQNGKYGSRNMGETGRKSTMKIADHDARSFCDTLERDVFYWMTHYNYPGHEDLAPRVKAIVDDPPDPLSFSEIIHRCAQAGYPIDADMTARMMNVALLPNPSRDPRPLQAPYTSPEGASNGSPDRAPKNGNKPRQTPKEGPPGGPAVPPTAPGGPGAD